MIPLKNNRYLCASYFDGLRIIDLNTETDSFYAEFYGGLGINKMIAFPNFDEDYFPLIINGIYATKSTQLLE